MQLIGGLHSPDVAVLPIGDHYTMGPRGAAVGARAPRRQALHAPSTRARSRCSTERRTSRASSPGDVEVIATEPGEAVTLEDSAGGARPDGEFPRSSSRESRRRRRARARRCARDPSAPARARAGPAGRRPGGLADGVARRPRAARGRLRRRPGRVDGPARASTSRSSRMARPVATYSIVARLPGRQWYVAVQSKFLAVGSVVPWAEAEVGAVATQSYANPSLRPRRARAAAAGAGSREGLDALTAPTRTRAPAAGDRRRRGSAATFTGSKCYEWAGGRTEDATPRRATSSCRPTPSTRSR